MYATTVGHICLHGAFGNGATKGTQSGGGPWPRAFVLLAVEHRAIDGLTESHCLFRFVKFVKLLLYNTILIP